MAAERKYEYEYEGNAARQLEQPVVEPRRRQPQRELPSKRQSHLNQERALQFRLIHMIPLTVALAIAAVLCIQYMELQRTVALRLQNIAAYENQLKEMQLENDARELEIENSVDLNEIYRQAVEELGMVNPGKDQYIQYEKIESEYVRQYEDIPNS